MRDARLTKGLRRGEELLILDLTNAQLPGWFPDWSPRYLPIKKGIWFHDFDVIEELLPTGWKGKMVKILRKEDPDVLIKRMILPLGINRKAFPPGAKILAEQPRQMELI